MKANRILIVIVAALLCSLGLAGATWAQAHAPLVYHGGPVMGNFTIYPLFYGSWSTVDINTKRAFLVGLADYLSGTNTPGNLRPMLYQYGVTKATVAAAKMAGTTATPKELSDSDIRDIIHANQKSGKLPAYSKSVLIMVFPAHGFTLKITGGCGYHSAESASAFYAAVPQDCDGPTTHLVTAHEVFEAATDPAINVASGWDEAVDGCTTVISLPFGKIPGAVDNTQGGTCSATGYIGTAWAYLWADQPAAASYTPDLTYQFNSSGAASTIARTDVGSYTATLPNLGGKPAGGGTVHVTAYGGTAATCKVAGWFSTGPDLQVNVRCFNNAGALADRSFVMSYTSVGSSTSPMAYLWADQPTSASYTPHPSYQFHSQGATNTVVRTGVGAYTALLPNLGASVSTTLGVKPATGHVQVTAYGTEAKRCKVAGWYPSGTTQQVNVRCFTIAGAPVDSRFTMTYVSSISLVGSPADSEPGTQSAYVWADQPSSLSYTPNLLYQFNNNTGATNTITRSGVGAYKVELPYESLGSGHVQVTAYGSGPEHCKVAYWTPAAGAQVRCFNSSGLPVDTYFDLTFLRSYFLR